MPAKKKARADNSKVELYDKLISTIPELERKGANNPYTAINGNMFTLLHQSSSLAIRLPKDRRDEFIKKHKTKLFEAYGCVMDEYVAVLENTQGLKGYLKSSYEYAKSLKPKPSKKS
jgi:hypothetical protein